MTTISCPTDTSISDAFNKNNKKSKYTPEQIKSVNNYNDYDYLARIPTPKLSCEYAAQNCARYSKESPHVPQDIACCDKGVMKILRCGGNQYPYTEMNGQIVPDDCHDSVRINAIEDSYKDILSQSKNIKDLKWKLMENNASNNKLIQEIDQNLANAINASMISKSKGISKLTSTDVQNSELINYLNGKYHLNDVLTFPFKGIPYKFRYTEHLENAIMKISTSCVGYDCTNEGGICRKGSSGASKGNYICADTGVHLSDKMKYQKQWIKTQRSGKSKYYEKTKQELNIADSLTCPVFIDGQQKYCTNFYNFSEPKGTFVKDKLSKAVYDNIKSIAVNMEVLTNPNVNIGSDYLATTHQCIDDNGNYQNVQTPMNNSGGNYSKYQNIADAITDSLVDKSNGKGVYKLTSEDVQNGKLLEYLKGEHDLDDVLTFTFNGLPYEFYYSEQIKSVMNTEPSGGIIYSLIDDIKKVNPIALMTRFIAQSDNASMKCSDIANQNPAYPLKRYDTIVTGLDLNGNKTFDTTERSDVNLANCYIANEGFESNKSTDETGTKSNSINFEKCPDKSQLNKLYNDLSFNAVNSDTVHTTALDISCCKKECESIDKSFKKQKIKCQQKCNSLFANFQSPVTYSNDMPKDNKTNELIQLADMVKQNYVGALITGGKGGDKMLGKNYVIPMDFGIDIPFTDEKVDGKCISSKNPGVKKQRYMYVRGIPKGDIAEKIGMSLNLPEEPPGTEKEATDAVAGWNKLSNDIGKDRLEQILRELKIKCKSFLYDVKVNEYGDWTPLQPLKIPPECKNHLKTITSTDEYNQLSDAISGSLRGLVPSIAEDLVDILAVATRNIPSMIDIETDTCKRVTKELGTARYNNPDTKQYSFETFANNTNDEPMNPYLRLFILFIVTLALLALLARFVRFY